MTFIEPSEKRELPVAPAGWFPLAYSINFEGRLARMSATVDWWNLPWEPMTKVFIPAGSRARIDILKDGQFHDGPQFELQSRFFPQFDQLPDGRWIVVEPRCEVGKKNAQLIGADGKILGDLCLGDGIQHVQCDAEGGIWVGYFDEGVCGNFGWGSEGHPEPIGWTGLNRFDDTGKITWSPYHSGRKPLASILDCYAMNVAARDLWVCFYTDFPIMHVDKNGDCRLWTNNKIAGANILAVDQEYMVLVGGYRREGHGDRIALLRFSNSQAIPVEEFQLKGLNQRDMPLAIGRGNAVHFVDHTAWYTMLVHDVVQTYQKNGGVK